MASASDGFLEQRAVLVYLFIISVLGALITWTMQQLVGTGVRQTETRPPHNAAADQLGNSAVNKTPINLE
jgi:divalent metal cation (Fe/Co/Zn/Cd) transporter